MAAANRTWELLDAVRNLVSEIVDPDSTSELSVMFRNSKTIGMFDKKFHKKLRKRIKSLSRKILGFKHKKSKDMIYLTYRQLQLYADSK
jgi:hypothetical protein